MGLITQIIVFYNGTEIDGDSGILKLSDSFIQADSQSSCLECTATMININYSCNQQLMESCRELYEYSFLIEEILKAFLLRHRAEVKSMILEEFDLNKQLYLERKDGFSEGHVAGRQSGESRLASLVQKTAYRFPL